MSLFALFTRLSSPDFAFLDLVDTDRFLRISTAATKLGPYQTIDQTHRLGLVHTGVWIHVTDVTGNKLLLLKRMPHLVTCPNSWGLVGEHSNREDKTPLETVQRALVEELWGGSNASYATSVQFIRNMTEHPVFYVREYGPRQQYRVDRQVTYLYEVRMQHASSDIENTFQLDHEVAEFQWVSLEDYQHWMERDASGRGHRADEGGGEGEAYTDFCHSTITQLGQFALERLRGLAAPRQNPSNATTNTTNTNTTKTNPYDVSRPS